MALKVLEDDCGIPVEDLERAFSSTFVCNSNAYYIIQPYVDRAHSPTETYDWYFANRRNRRPEVISWGWKDLSRLYSAGVPLIGKYVTTQREKGKVGLQADVLNKAIDVRPPRVRGQGGTQSNFVRNRCQRIKGTDLVFATYWWFAQLLK